MDGFIESELQTFAQTGAYTIPRDLNLERITDRFQELACAYSQTIVMPIFETIPEALRLDSARATFALARTVFNAFRYGSTWGSRQYPFLDDEPNLTFDVLTSKVISDVIVSGGWDPNVVTSSELDDKDIRVECMTCAHENPQKIGMKMRWRHAVSIMVSSFHVPTALTFILAISLCIGSQHDV